MVPLEDPILVFTLLALVMLAAPLLARRLRVPDVVLLLVAGAVLGPNGLGLLDRSTAVTLFGGVGMLYIMFLAGLEIDLHHFARVKGRSLLFGLLTFIIPQVLGTLAGRHVLGYDWRTSILLASMFASHTLLAYPLASRLGIARTEPVAVTVGATIITDTLALLVLAVIADAARGASLGAGFWAGILGGMVLLLGLTWWGLPRLARWFMEHVTEAGGTQFLFVLVTVCGCAYLSHFGKMEPIIGAFLAGAAYSRLIPENSVLMNRLVFTGNTLFIPFFLISVGMLVDPAALAGDLRGWGVMITMVVMVIATKYAAAGLSGRLFGYNADERKVMFGLSVVQAAATLAAVVVGYELQILDQRVLNGAIVMIMVTCPLGAWMVNRHGRLLALRRKPVDAPPVADQHLLVPVANAATAPLLLDFAFLLRDTALPGAIHPITVVRDEPDTAEAVTQSEKLLAKCLSHAAGAEMHVETAIRIAPNVADGIARAAKELRCDTVLVGWVAGRSVRTWLLGSVMQHLLETCHSRLFCCRLVRPFNTSHRLLVLLPPLAERRPDLPLLLRDAKNLSRQMGAEMRVYLGGDERAELRHRVEAARPSRPLIFVEADYLAELCTRLFAEVRDGDTVLLACERRRNALWTPVLDRVPDLVATRFPDNNLIAAYASWHDPGDDDEPEPASATPPDGRIEYQAVELPAGLGLDEALGRMSAAAFAAQPGAAAEAARILAVSAAAYPVELAKGVVLLHGHVASLDRPILLVGAGATPWTLPTVQTQARMLLALLTPREQSPTLHLQSIARLARQFHDPAFAENFAAAATATAACRLLEGGEDQ